MTDVAKWLRERHITEVECLVPDITGIARGKILPMQKFAASLRDGSLRLPESVFVQTVAGTYPEEPVTDVAVRDVRLLPDPTTLRLVPWYEEPTAQVINDCVYHDGVPVTIAPRQVLRRVLKLYADLGLRPVVSPELEFFLTKVNEDPDYPLVPPIGKNKRQETARQSYGIDAANEFDPVFEDVYDWCEAAEIDIDTLNHEAGAGQMEINFNHGDALVLADQVFLFKRTVRNAALKHGIYSTFMAKPMEHEPGSAMHIHQSVYDVATGANIFADAEGRATDAFRHYIGGLQRFTPAAMPLLAPNVNSYRRLMRFTDAPINLHWGYENRTAGFRVPESGSQSRRVENRVAGADVNPYLAFAATLGCGWLGLRDKIECEEPIRGSAYVRPHDLPRYLPDAINLLRATEPLHEALGPDFVTVLLAVKELEHEAYQSVISSWEREHLLLNV